jgi:hypothetical protein
MSEINREALARVLFACSVTGYDRGRDGDSPSEVGPPTLRALSVDVPFRREEWLAFAERVAEALRVKT